MTKKMQWTYSTHPGGDGLVTRGDQEPKVIRMKSRSDAFLMANAPTLNVALSLLAPALNELDKRAKQSLGIASLHARVNFALSLSKQHSVRPLCEGSWDIRHVGPHHARVVTDQKQNTETCDLPLSDALIIRAAPLTKETLNSVLLALLPYQGSLPDDIQDALDMTAIALRRADPLGEAALVA